MRSAGEGMLLTLSFCKLHFSAHERFHERFIFVPKPHHLPDALQGQICLCMHAFPSASQACTREASHPLTNAGFRNAESEHEMWPMS